MQEFSDKRICCDKFYFRENLYGEGGKKVIFYFIVYDTEFSMFKIEDIANPLIKDPHKQRVATYFLDKLFKREEPRVPKF